MPGVKSARRNDARGNNPEKKIKICVSAIPDPIGKPSAGSDASARYDGDYFCCCSNAKKNLVAKKF